MLTLKKYSLPTHIQNFYIDEENSHEIKEALEKGYSIVTSEVYKYNGANLQTDVVTELKDELYSVKKDNDNLQNKLTERDNDNAKIIDNIVNKRLEDKEKMLEEKDKRIKVIEDNSNDTKNELKQAKENAANAIRERDVARNDFNKLNLTLSNSAKKGKYAEDKLEGICTNYGPINKGYHSIDTSKISNYCDRHLIPIKYPNTENSPRFLLEVKNYNESNRNKLVQTEIPKMKRDIDGFIKRKVPIIATFFISIGCKIPNKEEISFETYNDTTIVYISNFGACSSPEQLLFFLLSVLSHAYETHKHKLAEDSSLYFIKGIVSRFINIYSKKFFTLDYFAKIKKALEEAEKNFNSDRADVINEILNVIKDYNNCLHNILEIDNEIESLLKRDASKLNFDDNCKIQISLGVLYKEKEFYKDRCKMLEKKEKVVENIEEKEIVVENIENSVMLKVENIHEEILEEEDTQDEENTQEEVSKKHLFQCEHCSQICKNQGGLTYHYKKCKNKNAENTSTEN